MARHFARIASDLDVEVVQEHNLVWLKIMSRLLKMRSRVNLATVSHPQLHHVPILKGIALQLCLALRLQNLEHSLIFVTDPGQALVHFHYS